MFLEYTKKKLINKSIVEYLQVKNQDIISVSGAGGKTSTIKLLAKNNFIVEVLQQRQRCLKQQMP